MKADERELVGASTMSKTNQVTVPKKVREILNLEPGQMIAFYVETDGKITIQK